MNLNLVFNLSKIKAWYKYKACQRQRQCCAWLLILSRLPVLLGWGSPYAQAEPAGLAPGMD